MSRDAFGLKSKLSGLMKANYVKVDDLNQIVYMDVNCTYIYNQQVHEGNLKKKTPFTDTSDYRSDERNYALIKTLA